MGLPLRRTGFVHRRSRIVSRLHCDQGCRGGAGLGGGKRQPLRIGAKGFGQQFVQTRFATRFRASAPLEELATSRGVSLLDIGRHFVAELPQHPLVLRGHSRRAPEDGYKIPGKVMKIAYTEELRAMEQTIIDLNDYIDQFDIRGGTHRGFIRVFNCGDDDAFEWNLGGRLYSPGKDSYQQIGSAERLKVTIDGKPVCELDIKSSYLTIFQAQRGQPLDFVNNPDPYELPELSATPRDVVKAFITATFGNGQFPARWSPKTAGDLKEKTGQQHPIQPVRDAVARAYPLLEGLRQDDAEPPIWARLMYLESDAVFRTMLALKDLNIPSLPVHDSLIVPRDKEQTARDILSVLYEDATAATPHIVVK